MAEALHRCCVCERAIRPGKEVYSNPYEEIARRHALCSDACARAWDADSHWLPSIAPQPCDPDEARRLLDVARRRARQGDPLEVLVKDLLSSGVGPAAVEAFLADAQLDDHLHGQREQALHRSFAVAALFTRKLGLLVSSLWRSLRPPARRSTEPARALLAAWRQRFEGAAQEPPARPPT